jgi:integrase/recombinase XerD
MGGRKTSDAPQGCFWKGGTLWGRIKVGGIEHRWSLRTRDADAAVRRRQARKEELTAAHHFGERRTTYKECFVAWAAEVVQNVGAQTAQRYAVSLKQLEPWLGDLHVDQIDRKVVNDLVAGRRLDEVSTATIKRDLTALSSLLQFAEDQEWREGNPALERSRRLKERRDPIVLPTHEDVERVIERVPGLLKQVVRAAWLTGARQNELVEATHRHVDLARGQWSIVGKGRKLRTLDLSEGAKALFAELPRYPKSPHLFWHGAGEPYRNLSSRFSELVAQVDEVARKSGTPFRPFRFHDLRHLYAVDYLKAGGNIYALKLLMGHSNLATTELYLDYLTPEEALRAKHGNSVVALRSVS